MVNPKNERLDLVMTSLKELRAEFVSYRRDAERELRNMSSRMGAFSLALKIIGSVGIALLGAMLYFVIFVIRQ